jgi:aromatic-amino-acid transaminase
VLTIEALGGTGALKVGADYLRRLLPGATVFISDPSWENHRALFEYAGFSGADLSLLRCATRGVDFAGMKAGLNSPAGRLDRGAACLLPQSDRRRSHAAQWREVIDTISARGLVAFIDIAYQGFADGISEDALALKAVCRSGLQFLVASSFSKSFSLYGERVGALSVVTANRDEAARVLSQIKRLVRTNYSNPPTHGGAIVAAVLSSPELRQMWEDELGEMRQRIRAMRVSLVDKLQGRGVSQDFSFVTSQRGMFSYTGLNVEQVDRLRDEFGIYAVSTGRICLAALNTRNIDYVADAIAAVL